MRLNKIKSGIIGVYKPVGPTSFDVIKQLRRLTGIKKIGHAGTLDPLASGVLVVGIGREATRRLHEVVAAEKEYAATVRFGMESATDDEEGEKQKIKFQKKPTRDEVKKMLAEFHGKIWQKPPMFSAVKVGGKRAYKLEREGDKVKLNKPPLEEKKIKIIKYKWPLLKLKVISGPGFYVRSLTRDLGEKLKVGGYLAELERTRVGKFIKKNAIKL